MKTLNQRNTAMARTKRDQMMRTRQTSKPSSNVAAETYFPKKLEKVESVIKKRVEIDKEIGRRRKMRN